MTTPRMTAHARGRCAEMGISTKVAKHIYRDRVMTYCGNPGTDARVAVSTDPRYAVVFREAVDGAVVIVTVVFRTEVVYERRGKSYTPIGG